MTDSNFRKVAILAQAAYVPINRLKIADIEQAHKLDPGSMTGLGITEKAFAGLEEDSLTMAYQATENALCRLQGFDSNDIQALYFGSETPVYAVKPTSSMLASFLRLNKQLFASDIEFACKAGTAAMQIVYNMILAGSIKVGLAVGSDVAKGAPSDLLEFTAASGASSIILGDYETYKSQAIAVINDSFSFTTDTADFWREEGEIYPTHTGRFSGTSYEKTILAAVKLFFKKHNLSASDFDQVVFHMPNGKLPVAVAMKLGFSFEQLKLGLVVSEIGNTYSACSLIGLTNVLENVGQNQKLLVCSYGSGSGSDVFSIETTSNKQIINDQQTVQNQLARKKYFSYSDYKLNSLKRYA